MPSDATAQATILLTTLNARYIHSSLGLRYLLANMGELKPHTKLVEFTINQRPVDIVETLLQLQPKIIGLSVYIWNAQQTTEVVRLLKTISPQTLIIVGGPEVSFEIDDQEITRHADYVITGQADLAFAETCRARLNNQPPLTKVIVPRPFKLNEISLPYREFSDNDIAQRVIYVEASRGCPFKCEFCLSALDKTVYPFDLDTFLNEMQLLFDHGVRSFKFIDRTFNLKIENSLRIMEFFRDKMRDEPVFLHFELIPDHLPEKLKQLIASFPEESLQFEVGIQTFNPTVQNLISRKQDNQQSADNLRWLSQHSHAHIHADLIVGLPGEDLASIAHGFDQLVSLEPHEIQVGMLKRLRGTPIIRHSEEFDMRYSPMPPYTVLSNSLLDFNTLQRLARFARYWDLIANSGRFKHSKAIILGEQPFNSFMQLSDWLFQRTGQTHQIALARLFKLLYNALINELQREPHEVMNCLALDYAASGLKGQPDFSVADSDIPVLPVRGQAESRQKRHLQNQD